MNSEIKISKELRDKISAKDYKLNPELIEEIKTVYYAITKEVLSKGRQLNTGCRSCMLSGYTVIDNYMQLSGKTEEEGKQDDENWMLDKALEGKSLKEMREMYPMIKARSKKEFISEVNQLKRVLIVEFNSQEAYDAYDVEPDKGVEVIKMLVEDNEDTTTVIAQNGLYLQEDIDTLKEELKK
jgi:hypothetical protein